MYKKYCLIASILSIMSIFITSMEVEHKKNKPIYIKTSDNLLCFNQNSLLFSTSNFLETYLDKINNCEVKERGTADNPLVLESVSSKQLLLIEELVKKKIDPNRPVTSKQLKPLERYLKGSKFKIYYLTQLLGVSDFLNVEKEIFKSVVPPLVEQLQDSDKLNKWLKIDCKNVSDKNKELLFSLMKKYLAHKIIPTPQYLQYLEQRNIKPMYLHQPQQHKVCVSLVAFSPDGRILASGSVNKYWRKIKLWDTKTGTKIRNFTDHTDFIKTAFVFHHDVVKPILKPYKKIDCLRNAKTGKKICTLKGHRFCVSSVAFSYDGRILVLGSVKGIIKLWDIETDKKICTLKGHRSCVSSVALSPKDIILASGSKDGTIKLWNIKTVTEILTLTGDNKLVRSVAFGPNGIMLASGSRNGITRFWYLIDLQEIKKLSTLELLLICAWQHAGIIKLQTYQELNTIYNKASDSVKKLIKTLIL